MKNFLNYIILLIIPLSNDVPIYNYISDKTFIKFSNLAF